MPQHDPIAFANALSAKLATRSRHVCVFLGAGLGRACGLPDVAQLQVRVIEQLTDSDQEALRRQLDGRNLEQALSRLRRIAGLVSGAEAVGGLTAERAAQLDAKVCQAIVKALDITGASLEPAQDFAAWVARANYLLPVELFTVNYDLLLETALDGSRVPYFDGFVGTLRARFHTELVEPAPGSDAESMPAFLARLWKLHGSVNWSRESNGQIVRLGHPVPDGLPAAIYPSDAKYEESRRVPFVVLQDRLRRALHHPETILIVSGYSFGDDDLNELLFDAASRRERSEFVALCYSEIPQELAKRAAKTPNLQVAGGREAICRGVKGSWTAPKEPPPSLWVDGQFGLRDFRELAAYLARGSSRALPHEPRAGVPGTTERAATNAKTPLGATDNV